MTPDTLRRCRSLLFVPASNARAIAKARSLGADAIILDLEDSVRDADKDAAREAMIAAAAAGFGGRPVIVRVNASRSPHFGEDIVAVRHCAAHSVLLAKTESPRDAADAVRLMTRPVLAMIETPLGVLDAAAIAPLSAALVAGTNDLSAMLGIPAGAGRAGLSHALQRIVLSARAANVAAFDGVYNGLAADEALEAECAEGRAFGFDGKTAIHPSQLDAINRAFAPDEAAIDAARRLVTAASGGAERHEGRMIEALHVAQARALLARADRSAESLATPESRP